MAPVTQVLLYISYAVLGLAAALLPPRLAGVDEQVATLLGVFVFFGAWQAHAWFIAHRLETADKERINRLEDNATILRHDLERTRRRLEMQRDGTSEKSEELVSELRILHTLLDQVMKREEALQSQMRAVAAKTDAGPVLELDELSVNEDRIAAAQPEEDNGGRVEPWFDEEDAEEVKAELSGEIALSTARGGPEVRLIRREETLLSVIRSSLSENRVDLYLQPIVALPGRQNTFYECFSRVRDEEGRVVLPAQYLRIAEEKGLIGTIDNLLLFRLIQLVRRLGPRRPEVRFFCNMSRFSMADAEFFPQFVDFMTSSSEFTKRLVLEINQSDYQTLDREVRGRLALLARRGFAFSLDQVMYFDEDFASLADNGFKFIKADMQALSAQYEIGDLPGVKARLKREGLKLIASRVEDEATVLMALDGEMELAQGYLFGEPRPAADFNRDF
ncbi:EAL domain-containing protein [Gimibacter soli]|uniref:EAL domain-containing protein n=1 Tax=Gimibacter soli TaxID=3024400 RepID=A0AAE9XTM9_9PROT|nr:EAL domain-containing protein [Gimibacter soli]WCL55000.1 EAL domain-containing protein [Gimibacter soli]